LLQASCVTLSERDKQKYVNPPFIIKDLHTSSRDIFILYQNIYYVTTQIQNIHEERRTLSTVDNINIHYNKIQYAMTLCSILHERYMQMSWLSVGQ